MNDSLDNKQVRVDPTLLLGHSEYLGSDWDSALVRLATELNKTITVQDGLNNIYPPKWRLECGKWVQIGINDFYFGLEAQETAPYGYWEVLGKDSMNRRWEARVGRATKINEIYEDLKAITIAHHIRDELEQAGKPIFYPKNGRIGIGLRKHVKGAKQIQDVLLYQSGVYNSTRDVGVWTIQRVQDDNYQFVSNVADLCSHKWAIVDTPGSTINDVFSKIAAGLQREGFLTRINSHQVGHSSGIDSLDI